MKGGKIQMSLFFLVATCGWNGLLLLLSRLIPEFPNSRFFLEPINRELGGTTVMKLQKWQKMKCFGDFLLL